MKRIRDTVYVVGAGFSKGCGYPLTRDLLFDVWARIDDTHRDSLRKIIEFHHPHFREDKQASFPNIEKLLTELTVNIDLFKSSRRYKGNFQKEELIEARQALLSTIASWFHEIYKDAKLTPWLDEFVQIVQEEEAGIITFNWDLLLDQKMFGRDITPDQYGLGKELPKNGPFILKPHGSLNWYTSDEVNSVIEERRLILFHARKSNHQVEVFIPPREIKTKVNKKYTPLIVAPSYLKDFSKPVFRHIWKHSTELLSTAKRIIFLGYSLPDDDLQARYILRCGFHNQIEGIIRRNGRLIPTGKSKVVVVNPDYEAVKRIRDILNPGVRVSRPAKTVEQWLRDTHRS
ncbi:SIR2 family protein [Sideroxydans lithotrophicus]|uniref:Uncharacterized protein n=1 Tax=Sideroxydans lithotrophicus (strain ES-1) TaxID=580332 RepID=D5CQV5_SIDLE|nr:SIR2 family protein [Sideroxydans lithotrophicus]ADE11341.1 hypothetical protein Slit_1103 [Sideroxydans lithotrophicus ES-1]